MTAAPARSAFLCNRAQGAIFFGPESEAEEGLSSGEDDDELLESGLSDGVPRPWGLQPPPGFQDAGARRGVPRGRACWLLAAAAWPRLAANAGSGSPSHPAAVDAACVELCRLAPASLPAGWGMRPGPEEDAPGVMELLSQALRRTGGGTVALVGPQARGRRRAGRALGHGRGLLC